MRFIPGDAKGGIQPIDESAKFAMQRFGFSTLEEVKTGRRVITLWYRMNDEKEWEYNHYVNGVAEGILPVPKHPNQVKTWKSGKWATASAVMYYNQIIEVQELIPTK